MLILNKELKKLSALDIILEFKSRLEGLNPDHAQLEKCRNKTLIVTALEELKESNPIKYIKAYETFKIIYD